MTKVEHAVAPLLALIRERESGPAAARMQGVPSEYDVVWGGIHPQHRPSHMRGKLLTQMTVADILEWQDAIVDAGARSSAAGAYQIIRKTLRGLKLSPAAVFTPALQDDAAIRLLHGRGLQRFLEGQMSRGAFGDAIAREWASFPLLTGPKRGSGAYDGDGLNKAHLRPERVEACLDLVLLRYGAPVPHPPEVPPPVLPAAPPSIWAALARIIASLFRRTA